MTNDSDTEGTDARVDDGDAALRDELSFEEFLSIAALEDDLGLEPEGADAPSAEESLHVVHSLGVLEPALVRSVDVGGIEASLTTAPVDPPARTEIDEALDTEAADEPHELAVDEVLDATMHSDDPALEHDWVAVEDAGRRRGDDDAAMPRGATDFVCSSCFLVRSQAQRAEPGGDRCVDCVS